MKNEKQLKMNTAEKYHLEYSEIHGQFHFAHDNTRKSNHFKVICCNLSLSQCCEFVEKINSKHKSISKSEGPFPSFSVIKNEFSDFLTT